MEEFIFLCDGLLDCVVAVVAMDKEPDFAFAGGYAFSYIFSSECVQCLLDELASEYIMMRHGNT